LIDLPSNTYKKEHHAKKASYLLMTGSRRPIKDRIMAAHLVFGLIIFLVSYAGSAFLLIEILMWAMGRLDRPKAPAATPIWALESRLASTLSYQATLGRTCQPEGYMITTSEAHQFDFPARADCQQPSLAYPA
jgi:hypothetical protein